MYIWVILATFLAVLASYTLSPRADIRQITVEPLAEAAVEKLVTKHKAARDYVKYRKKPYVSNPPNVEYSPGVIADEDLDSYIAFGHYNDPAYISQIFCMNEDMTVSYGEQAQCSVRRNKKMLVTYGVIPTRWINQATELEEPNVDFMNALRNTVEGGTMFGYTAPVLAGTSTDKNISGSSVRIIDRDRADIYVPSAVVEDATFKEVCDLSKGWVCLVYLSSV